MKILITGGLGFIGSALIRYIIQHTDDTVINVDKMTYSANKQSLVMIAQSHRYVLEPVDICSSREINRIFNYYQPDVVMHLAAESHVDRSINNSTAFIQTNIIGTHVLLEESVRYWRLLSEERKRLFRFHHISTDEVYGDLENDASLFNEKTSYAPSSPYSASKASADHLVRAWFRTYDLPVLITNCSNNYGPYQFPEKLIPLIILNAMAGYQLPVYGNGEQVRDWLYVYDHVQGLYQVVKKGRVGETYNIGGQNEKRNIDVVYAICELLEELLPVKPKGLFNYKDLIIYVKDRPGHDKRYAIDATKIKQELGWTPTEKFESGLRKTVEWYLKNSHWVACVKNGSYRTHEALLSFT